MPISLFYYLELLMNVLNEFIDYVWDFYNPEEGLYPIKGLTKQDIFEALFVYLDRIDEAAENNNLYLSLIHISEPTRPY